MSEHNSKAGWAKRGSSALAAMDQAEKEKQERAERGFMPFRMWLKKGEEVEVIILDHAFVSDEPGEGGALIREHNIKGSDGKWGNFESCCGEFAPCPLCDKAGSDTITQPYFVVLLSVLVLKEWTSSKTGEKHPYSRMLLPIKLAQKERFLELQKHAMKANGTMRGMYLILKRGMEDQSVATGEPIMLDNGKLYDFVSEEELVKDYGHPPVKNREGKVLKKANADLEPFDYDLLFPRPDPDDLARRFGGRAAAGSRRSAAEDWDKEQGAQQPAQGASRRRATAPAEDKDDIDTSPPVSGRRRPAPQQAEETPPAGPARRRGGARTEQPAEGAW